MRRPSAGLLALAAIGAFVAAFAVLPAGAWFAQAVGPDPASGALPAALGSAGTRAAFRSSAVQGGLSAALAVALGYPAGVFLGRFRFVGRRAVRAALLLPFLLPGLVMVFGVLDLLGPTGVLGGPLPGARWFASGVPGIVAVNLFYNVPIVVVLTAAGCEASSRTLEESVASLGGGPWRAYRESWGAPSAVGAACGGLLTFVLSALSFAPPILLCGNRCATVEVEVYQLAELAGEPRLAGALALLLVAAFAAPAIAYVLLARRLRAARGARYRPPPPAWDRPGTWALAGAFALVVLAEGALLAAVVVRSVLPPGGGPLAHGWSVLASPATAADLGIAPAAAVGNTFFFAALAAAVAVVVAVLSAYALARRPRAGAGLGLLVFVPLLLSPVVLAESLSLFWGPALGGPANVWILIVLSQALLAVPFALQSLEIPLGSLPRGAAEAAETLGASRWGAFVDAELPRIRRGLETAVLFGFALGLGEFTATNFFVSSGGTAGYRTLPVAIYVLAESPRLPGAADAATAAAALLLFVSLGVFAAVVAVGGTDER